MEKRQILVPMDFSELSRSALDFATVFAKDSGAELLIVHVMDPELRNLEGMGPVEALEAVENALQALRPSDESVGCSHRMIEGTPVHKILEVAAENAVEMIVMGTHGRTGLSRLVMGSVAEAVVRKAPCPVLTLRKPIASETNEETPASES